MKANEEGITHMAKAKFSKGFELFGEHLTSESERGAGAGRGFGRASCGRRLKSGQADVSGLSDKIPFTHFFRQASVLLSRKNDLLPAYTPISRRT